MMSVVRSHHPKYRTKLCRNFASGGCPFGQKCSFLHPASRINPPSVLAQHHSNWNLLLPQLLSLSYQQGAQKKMPLQSPRFQGSQLIDEDPSPSTSLLLSTSDCTSSEQLPETRRSNRRKRYPCRHFNRTGGWCPAGAQCRFHHDVAALPSADIPKLERTPPFENHAYEEGRTISGGVLMGKQLPSSPIISLEHPEHPRYNQVEPAQQCLSTSVTALDDFSDQPMCWPNYPWQPYQLYYGAVPAATIVPVPATVAPSSAVQHTVYPPQALTAPNGTRTSLPLGAYEVNGTTYFPSSMISAPAPAPVTHPVPVHPASYNHSMAPAYPYYAPPTLPTSYYDIPNQTTNVRHQTFDPFASDQMMPSELPVIPRLEDYQISPIQQDVFPWPLSSPPVLTGDLVSTTTADKPSVSPDYEFPYRPPKNQRVGHARRVSVNVKKQGRTNSG